MRFQYLRWWLAAIQLVIALALYIFAPIYSASIGHRDILTNSDFAPGSYQLDKIQAALNFPARSLTSAFAGNFNEAITAGPTRPVRYSDIVFFGFVFFVWFAIGTSIQRWVARTGTHEFSAAFRIAVESATVVFFAFTAVGCIHDLVFPRPDRSFGLLRPGLAWSIAIVIGAAMLLATDFLSLRDGQKRQA